MEYIFHLLKQTSLFVPSDIKTVSTRDWTVTAEVSR